MATSDLNDSKSADARRPNVNGFSRLEALQAHLGNLSELASLPQGARERLAQWIFVHAPYRNQAHLEKALATTEIDGVKRSHQLAVANSLSTGMDRRKFLSLSLGAPSLASLTLGGWLFLRPDDTPERSIPQRLRVSALLRECSTSQQTVGQTIRAAVAATGIEPTASHAQFRNWRGLVHALDMSNWIEAANFLYGSSLCGTLEPARDHVAYGAIADILLVLNDAWSYLLESQERWQDEYFVAYSFGKMPSLGAPDAGPRNYPGEDQKAGQAIQLVTVLAHVFRLLEVVNQRSQQPGKAISGAPIRFTQGHNFSYAHAAEDLQSSDLFPPDRKTILVNWDAHSDVAAPFAHPRITLENAVEQLMRADSFEQRVDVTSYMSIAGWILPLVYQGYFRWRDQPAQLVWIAPREAYETSRGSMSPFGKYTITVGSRQGPSGRDVHGYSDSKPLRTVSSADGLENQQTLEVHILDPDDAAGIAAAIGDAQIFLSGDVDYSGTQEPGLRPRLGVFPHYPLNQSPAEQARHRQLVNQFGEFFEQYSDQIRSASIANSPNFTVDEEIRKPAAKLMHALVGGRFDDQPQWIGAEWERVAVPNTDSLSAVMKYILTAGGVAGIAALVAALEMHRRHVDDVRSLMESKG